MPSSTADLGGQPLALLLAGQVGGTESTVPYWESSLAAASPASGLRELM